jgi:hypothetical protein
MTDSVLYLTGFAAGTILSMVTYAMIMGFVAAKTSDFPHSKTFRNLRIGAGLLAIGVGVYWILG